MSVMITWYPLLDVSKSEVTPRYSQNKQEKGFLEDERPHDSYSLPLILGNWLVTGKYM